MSNVAKALEKQYGHWGRSPIFDIADWLDEVIDGNTRLGYWEWVASKEASRHEEE